MQLAESLMGKLHKELDAAIKDQLSQIPPYLWGMAQIKYSDVELAAERPADDNTTKFVASQKIRVEVAMPAEHILQASRIREAIGLPPIEWPDWITAKEASTD